MKTFTIIKGDRHNEKIHQLAWTDAFNFLLRAKGAIEMKIGEEPQWKAWRW